jgi:hypothetical protein
MSDVLMLLMFDGARERTLAHYRDLLEDTGWQLEQVVPSPGPMSVIEARRIKNQRKTSSLTRSQGSSCNAVAVRLPEAPDRANNCLLLSHPGQKGSLEPPTLQAVALPCPKVSWIQQRRPAL